MNQTTFSFPQMVNRGSRKTELSTTYKSINECLGILLRTRPGEMLGDPEFGCNLLDRVFAYNGVIIESLVREDILNAVSKFEPRIKMTERDITIVHDTNTLKIYLMYTIKQTGEINEYNMEITPNDNPYKDIKV